MKKVTASEARKHWFRILDDAAHGEVIVLERKGRRLVLRREEPDKPGTVAKGPDIAVSCALRMPTRPTGGPGSGGALTVA